MWNPSSAKLMNVEADEAGRLAAFRTRFGRGFDASSASKEVAMDKSAQAESDASAQAGETGLEDMDMEQEEESLLDLISSFGQDGAGQTSQTPDTRHKAEKKGKKR